jgi:hypothetical protein
MTKNDLDKLFKEADASQFGASCDLQNKEFMALIKPLLIRIFEKTFIVYKGKIYTTNTLPSGDWYVDRLNLYFSSIMEFRAYLHMAEMQLKVANVTLKELS